MIGYVHVIMEPFFNVVRTKQEADRRKIESRNGGKL